MIKIIKQGLPTEAPVFYEDCLESTNSALKAMALQGTADRTVLIAGRQTAGRGRQGRSFISPEGGLYLSMLLSFDKPDNRLLSLTAVAAVAIMEALENALNVKPMIKWPNDLELNGKKLCGILTEAVTRGDKLDIVVGAGINLNTASFPDEINDRACSVYTETGTLCNIEDLYTPVISALLRRFEQLPIIPEDCLDIYSSRCSTIGKQISGGGTAECVDKDFSLLIRMPDGRLERKYFGEILQYDN